MNSPEVREHVIELVREACASGARLEMACDMADISARTYNRWLAAYAATGEHVDKRTTAERPEPPNKIPAEERGNIFNLMNEGKFSSLPPCQIVPALADEGIYVASESTMYRILHEYDAIKHRGRSKAPERRSATTHKATAPNQVYTWDITYLNGPVKGVHYYLYLITDLFSRKIVAWEIWEDESAEHASQLISRAVLAEKLNPKKKPLVLHSDNGSPMKGATMLETLYRLGVTPSNSRPRVSNDNPYVESLFKTMKYNSGYLPKGFGSIEEAREWVLGFVSWYNNEHRHSGIKYLTPNQRHSKNHGLDILERRKRVYEAARKVHPERWSKGTRDWSIDAEVWLNPENNAHKASTREASA